MENFEALRQYMLSTDVKLIKRIHVTWRDMLHNFNSFPRASLAIDKLIQHVLCIIKSH